MLSVTMILAIFWQSTRIGKPKLANAIIGICITTAVLIWGLIINSHGDEITFLSIEISLGFFIFLMILWYLMDGLEVLLAVLKKQGKADQAISINLEGRKKTAVLLIVLAAGIVLFIVGGSIPSGDSASGPLMILGGLATCISLFTLLLAWLQRQAKKDAGWPTSAPGLDEAQVEKTVTLEIKWRSDPIVYDRPVWIWLDGQCVEQGTFNKPFNVSVPTTEGLHKLSLNKFGGAPNLTFQAEKSQTYAIDLEWNKLTGKYKFTCPALNQASK